MWKCWTRRPSVPGSHSVRWNGRGRPATAPVSGLAGFGALASQPEVQGHCLAMHAELARDPPAGPALFS